MNILHIAPINFNKASGLSYSIPSLVSAQNKIDNITVALLLSSNIEKIVKEYDFPVFTCKGDNVKYDLTSLPQPYNKPDLVVFHSTYIYFHIKTAKYLNNNGIPYIIVPRGGMTVGAQKSKFFKKKIANIMVYNNYVNKCLALHCLTKGEAKATKQWNKRMFIVGNGIDVPNELSLSNPGKNEDIKFTFIGRLDSYHKGLDLLLKGIALSSDKIRQNKGKFNIFGPDWEGSTKLINKQILEYKIQDVVNINGAVFDDNKKQILKESDVFVLTSRFEGHPMGVLEAMSYGIPCLLTPGTNISQEVFRANAGWQVELTANSIANGINRVLEEKKELKKKGLNARKLVVDNYSWDKIAEATIRCYCNILGF